MANKALRFLLNPGDHTRVASAGLLVLRLAVGVSLFIDHGWHHLNNLKTIQTGDPLGMGGERWVYVVLMGQAIGPLLIALGLLTRISALACAVVAGAGFFMLAEDATVTQHESALLYFAIFVALLFTSAGDFSIDGLLVAPEGDDGGGGGGGDDG